MENKLITRIVDGSLSSIYLCDAESYDLLYANERIAKAVGKTAAAASGQKCYQYLKNLSEPCANCFLKDCLKNPNDFTTKDYISEATGKHYVMRGKIIMWQGRRAMLNYMMDETDRLREQSELRALLNGLLSGVGIYHLYEDGTLDAIYMNDGYYDNLLGISREARVLYERTNNVNAIYPEDRPRIAEALEALRVSGGDSLKIEFRILTKGDEYKWVLASTSVTERIQGRLTLYACYSDIDELKHAQLQLAQMQRETRLRYENELQLRNEMTKNSLVSYTVNITQKLIESCQSVFNDRPLMYAGASITEELGDSLLEGVFEADRPIVRQRLLTNGLMDLYKNGESSIEAVYRRIFPSGELHWVRSNATITRRPDSGDLVAFVYTRDIDMGRKNALAIASVLEEEIELVCVVKARTGEARFAKAAPTTGFATDIEFDYDKELRRRVFVNVFDEDIVGCEDAMYLANIKHHLETETFFSHTYRMYSADGSVKRKKVRIFYLDDTHEEVVIIRRDITDLYEEEQQQKRALEAAVDAANAANRAKSAFVSRMSHDMRTPLNAVLALSGKELLAGLNESGKDEHLSQIHASGEYLLGIINDVLDMSRIESRKLILSREPCSYAEFMSTIDTIIGEQCKQKGVKFESSANITELVLLTDKVRLKQIFVNLLSNAVKFTPKGGTVSFNVQSTIISARAAVLDFTVTDTGIGMSEEFLPHAFENFTQENRMSGLGSLQGTGLGLSIVKQLTELMRGKITVESKLGEGTKFFVSLPFDTAGDVALAQKAKTKNYDKLKGINVLLFEDLKLNARIAAGLLERKGCTVVHALDGAEGLKLFEDSEPGFYKVILMDIRMPVMDGIEATKRIRALNRPDAKTVPIFAMTADAFAEAVQQNLDAGMNGHLTKPIEPEKMFTMIMDSL